MGGRHTPLERYVQLERHFSKYWPDEGEPHGRQKFLDASLRWITWSQVLKHRCTVVIAPSGMGKTEEFEQQAGSLREQGKPAFFCRLEELANLPLGSTLEIGEKSELEVWLSSADDGWFFLDSIDEAKLVNINHFERAIKAFVEVVKPHLTRAHIVLSSRPHAWAAYDTQMLCNQLELIPDDTKRAEADAVEDEEQEAIEFEGILDDVSVSIRNPRNAPEILHVLTLAPLGTTEIRAFAEARGIGDLDAFMREVWKRNAAALASRPEDLQGLIDDWCTSKRIGSYHDVVLRNVTRRIKEPDPRRRQAAQLTPERALVGAEWLAAALTFTKKSSLLLPDRSPLDAKVRDELLNPDDVLLDWRPAEVQELLGCGLFDESLFGSVRFHHRNAREYLTARWLHRLLGNRKHRRSVHELLFAQPYGCEKPVVVPSLKPIAAWLSLWDQKIREAVRAVDPKVLLEYGDATLLPVGLRADMLRDFAKRYADQKQTPLHLGVREVGRLADPGLLPVIRELLEQYWEHNDIRELLMRLVREGNLQGLGELMLGVATDTQVDGYSRICAVEVIGANGTRQEMEQLKKVLVVSRGTNDRELFGALLNALYPMSLSGNEVISLLENPPGCRKGYMDSLPSTLTRIVRKTPAAEAATLLGGMVALLKRPPFQDEWLRISCQYVWLLPAALVAAERLISAQPNGPFDDIVLATVAMAQQADHLESSLTRVAGDAKELLSNNTALKHSVFWYLVEERRAAMPSRRFTNHWSVAPWSCDLLRVFGEADAPLFLDAMGARVEMDDRRIALSALAEIYKSEGCPDLLLEQIRHGAAGTAELEAALDEALNPKPSPEREAHRRERHNWRQESAARMAREAQKRQEAVTWFKANADALQVGDYAREGKLLKNIVWLYHRVVEKARSGNRWSVSNWRLLEPEFGSEVAKAFRDYCVAYWRLYQPPLRSEIADETNGTPSNVIIGLSGLAMEAADDKVWANKLAAGEAALATRYALRELNQLPGWLGGLIAAHPEPVKAVLVGEMRWEMHEPRVKDEGGYVLSRLRGNASSVRRALRSEILEILEQRPVADEKALTEALAVVLRNPDAVPPSFEELAAERARQAGSDDLKSAWLAALLCLDGERGVTALESWVNDAADATTSEYRASKVLTHALGDRFQGFGSVHTHYRQAKLLLRLMKLAHAHIRLADDIEHEDTYSPVLRDHAQDARGEILNLLCELPGRETYDALIELSDFLSGIYSRNQMRILAERRAEADTEPAAWAAEDVDAFAAAAERGPRTQRDLFQIALYRLDDLKFDLEGGDESEASLLRRIEDEPELRRVIANRLRQSAAGKYTTGSEEELKDKTRTDIRLHHPAVEARIPIELKIADKWSAAELRERLENQLVGQYMDESRYGIFLIVRRGAEKDRTSWHLGKVEVKQKLSFQTLTDWLKKEAADLVRHNPGIDGLNVVAIDLTKPNPRRTANVEKRPTERRKRTARATKQST